MKRLRSLAGQLITKALLELDPEAPVESVLEKIEFPQDQKMGDLAFPCFTYAKVRKKNPKIIANEIAPKIKDKTFVKVLATGPYVNFFIAPAALIPTVSEVLAKKERYGTQTKENPKTYLIEYSSPNVAKEFHIGHFRNTILGQSLNNLITASGDITISINHLGDWGSQFGKVIYAYETWGKEADLSKAPIDYLTKLYVKFHEKAESDPELENKARLIFQRIESGDQKYTKIWQQFVNLSINDLKKIYETLGVKFDHYIGESFYFEKVATLIKTLTAKKLLETSDGAEIVRLDDFNMPPCLILTQKGTTLYASRDIAAAIYRKDYFNFDHSLYVVGSEQSLHFKQIFKVIELMGLDWAQNLEHISYGMYRFKDGSFSTRKGKVVLVKDIINEAKTKVLEIINNKNPELQNKESVANDIALGALIFNDLSTDRVKDVEFSWEKILDFDGDTGPYVQYTHARACSILRKSDIDTTQLTYDKDAIENLLQEPLASSLVKQIAKLESSIEASATLRKPSILATFCVDTAKAFNSFYRQIRVLDPSLHPRDQGARLILVKVASLTIRNALEKLCIHAPVEM